jgi:guanylate kinase
MKVPSPLLILSGPSGSGKSTLIRRLLEESGLPLRLSVSATTRPARPGERNGVDYYFWTPAQFEDRVRRGAFLEWAEIHGHRYGTLRSEVTPERRQKEMVVLDIDVQGAEQVRRQCPDHVSVFLRAPSLEVYEQRLRRRGTEDDAAIRARVALAQKEVARAEDYHYQVINDDLDAAVAQVRAIVMRSMGKE